MVLELLWFGAGSPRGCYAGPGAGGPACIAVLDLALRLVAKPAGELVGAPALAPPAEPVSGRTPTPEPALERTCAPAQEAGMEPVPEQDVAGMSAPELVLCPEVASALRLPLVPKAAFALELAQQPALAGLLLRTRYENCCCRRL